MLYDVAVVGSGFSAIAVTIHLLRLLPASASIAIVGDDPGFGRGTAYRTEFYIHRLNVAAGRMSVLPDAPDDFVEWLEQNGRQASADGFASRVDYGLYLRDRLASLLRDRDRRVRFDFLRAKAASCVHCGEAGLVFHLDNGAKLSARNAVLCLGVGNADLPLERGKVDPSAERRIVRNPWRLNWLSKVGRGDKICILGSGLTMIDQVLALRIHGHRGPIRVLSRRGLLAHMHARAGDRAQAVKPEFPSSREISALLAGFRGQVRAGADWRGLMDGLRPMTQGLWQELSKEQRARFLRHGLAWWNIHRHRVAPEIFSKIDSLRKDGIMTVHAGFLQAIEEGAHSASVTYIERRSRRHVTFQTDWVLNCTGMERAGVAHSPLLRIMQRQGLITADELGLGLSVDKDSRVLDSNEVPQPGLYAVGGVTAGQFWEITAVPDIRVQAKAVAGAIVSGLRQ
ncbi:FAD-binding protein [Sinorhizobium meliloti]|uniref:FAD/NAD(P)-binding protein n=1 Tax=Sinorhizobium medicae TaxID=110321 RepID=UPI00035F69B4|nr:FAD/NAD(P)-binding protein [Sinorhizobium medicae]MDW9775135.1 FAD-binding protein [Sinorhizobium meliloti]MDW9849614.1 FAD-binding protein [Sinorhizobium meliloti]MDX0146461.1 FAD-binding protein [Sinorhizobium meliloti]MDX0152635.1 FAD-binding protein [Sinorhizobium meliloti]MDX0171534.1 FAD-binding protein [Sinorhizobium meliloti]